MSAPGAPVSASKTPRRRALLVLVLAGMGVLGWANAPPTEPLATGVTADRVVVDKRLRTLRLMREGAVLKTYAVSLGGAPEGPKGQEGDERTPEGRYVLDGRNPQSMAHLSLHVSYPDPADSARAAQTGVTPGGMIMVHGIRNGLGWLGRLHRFVDWTDGCVAVTNAEMDELWRAIPTGTPIEIRP